MTNHSATHTSFIIEREFAASPQTVFQAWADPVAKQRWSDCHPDHTTDYSLDFRPLGRESHRVVNPNGTTQMIEKVFFDIVPGARIVFAYDIQLNERRLSVSLVTIEFRSTPKGTHMAFAEQLTFLDGHDDRAERIRGTEEGFDRLALSLQRPTRPAKRMPS